jgi:hypothetical protein
MKRLDCCTLYVVVVVCCMSVHTVHSSVSPRERDMAAANIFNAAVDGLIFRSNFCSGNLYAVEKEQGSGSHLWKCWTAKDCQHKPFQRRSSSWFYFGVSGASAGQEVTIKMMNLNRQSQLYKHGYTPVARVGQQGEWRPLLRSSTSYEEVDGAVLQLTFTYRATCAREVFFAFCYPHSYEECQLYLSTLLERVEADGAAINPSMLPPASSQIYVHREILTHSSGGRNCDMLTISDCTGICESPAENSFEFSGEKNVIFLSARVHPGETPSSFVLQGIIEMLLSSDPRAAKLRSKYVFKIVPMLNPDGVAMGHYRHDLQGRNLNRYYASPSAEAEPTIHAVKKVVMKYSQRSEGEGRLFVYLDIHAHASKRGCFVYGNSLPSLREQVQNQLLPLLWAANSAYFSYSRSNFSKANMHRVDRGDVEFGLSAEGTGRVWYGVNARVTHSYTLEVNYNCGCGESNAISAAPKGCPASPPRKAKRFTRYCPQSWREVGRGFLASLLDLSGDNVWSRVPTSLKSLERAHRLVKAELRCQSAYQDQSLRLRLAHSSAQKAPEKAVAHSESKRAPMMGSGLLVLGSK